MAIPTSAFTSGTTLPDPVVFNSDFPILVEECVTGEEISIDAVVQNGVVTPLFLARKVVGYPPYAEEIGAAELDLEVPFHRTELRDAVGP